jgi:hypothetical protein
VDAIQVTEENIDEVAEWCNGDVRFTDKGKNDKKKYVKVRVLRPLNEKQSMAFVGDYILYAGTGYKVYTHRAFVESFEPAEDDDNYGEELGKTMPVTGLHVQTIEEFIKE